MINPLASAIKISGSGLLAQSQRISVISENIANSSSTGATPGSDAYRRKTISFETALDDASGDVGVKVGEIGQDESPFKTDFMPSHPAADSNGMVKLPNVDVAIEMADMREATRSYQANVQAVKQAREMVSMTINMMGAGS